MLLTLPLGLSGASAAMENVVSQLFSQHAAAESIFFAMVPPAVDMVSLRSAADCSAHVFDHELQAHQGMAHLHASAQETLRSALGYLSCDRENAHQMSRQL